MIVIVTLQVCSVRWYMFSVFFFFVPRGGRKKLIIYFIYWSTQLTENKETEEYKQNTTQPKSMEEIVSKKDLSSLITYEE